MRLPNWILRLTVLGLSALLLASCGSDDDGSTKPDGNQPPTLSGPELVEAIDFNSEDPTAKAAELMVSGGLLMAQSATNLGGLMLGPLATANWEASGGCWAYSHDQQGCMWAFEACETDGGFTWTVTLDGTCDEETFDNWVGIRGTTDIEGKSGTLRFYMANTTAIEVALTWNTAADGKSGTWNFYGGDVSTQNLELILTWSESAPGVGQIVWEAPLEARWVLDYLAGGNAGTMRFYDWLGSWFLKTEITWTADGHGEWTEYDPIGGDTTQTW